MQMNPRIIKCILQMVQTVNLFEFWLSVPGNWNLTSKCCMNKVNTILIPLFETTSRPPRFALKYVGSLQGFLLSSLVNCSVNYLLYGFIHFSELWTRLLVNSIVVLHFRIIQFSNPKQEHNQKPERITLTPGSSDVLGSSSLEKNYHKIGTTVN